MARERGLEHGNPARSSLYGMLVQAFVGFMLLAVLAANVGVLWVAVEATTIVTTFLVGYRRTRGSLEASWKYIVICSVGIALAFLGTVFVYLAALHAGGHSAQALDWTSLMAHARRFDPSLMRLAFGAARPRLRHQGRARPDAQLAPRRPQPGARPGVGTDVGGPPRPWPSTPSCASRRSPT